MEVDVNEENIDSWMESVLPEVWWCFWRWSRRLGKKKKKKKKDATTRNQWSRRLARDAIPLFQVQQNTPVKRTKGAPDNEGMLVMRMETPQPRY